MQRRVTRTRDEPRPSTDDRVGTVISRRCFLTIMVALTLSATTACSSDGNRRAAVERPRIGDHWHPYLGVNLCGRWLPAVPVFETRDGSVDLGSSGPNIRAAKRAGIHSHDDFIIHDHPFARDETGAKNTLGRFLNYAQSKVTASSITLWPAWAEASYRNGDQCPDSSEPGTLRWKVGRVGEPWPAESRRGDPATIRLRNGEIIAIYFLPATAALDEPPGANAALAQIGDLSGAATTPPSS